LRFSLSDVVFSSLLFDTNGLFYRHQFILLQVNLAISFATTLIWTPCINLLSLLFWIRCATLALSNLCLERPPIWQRLPAVLRRTCHLSTIRVKFQLSSTVSVLVWFFWNY